MTAEMPRTKPNIMITARLLLMPVLEVGGTERCGLRQSREVLRARTAAAMRSDGSRERTLVRMCLMIFIRVVSCYFSFVVSGFSAEHATTISQTREAKMYVIHKMQ